MSFPRRVATLGAAFLFLALAACGHEAPTNPTAASRTPMPPGEATVWLMPQHMNDNLTAALHTAWVARNPGTTLTIAAIPDGGMGDLSASGAPDAVEVSIPDVAGLASSGLIAEAAAPPGTLAPLTDSVAIEGMTYAAPLTANIAGIYRRPDLWQAANVSAPTSLAEMASASAAVSAAMPDQKADLCGLRADSVDWMSVLPWIYAAGGRAAVESRGTWNAGLTDPATITGLTAWQAAAAGCGSPSPWLHLNDASDDPAAPDPNAPMPIHLDAVSAPGLLSNASEVGDLIIGPAGEDRAWNPLRFDFLAMPGSGVDGGTGVGPAALPILGTALVANANSPDMGARLAALAGDPGVLAALAASGLVPATGDVSGLPPALGAAATPILTSAVPWPAVPGWAALMASGQPTALLSEILAGGDVSALCAEYDPGFTTLLNTKP